MLRNAFIGGKYKGKQGNGYPRSKDSGWEQLKKRVRFRKEEGHVKKKK